ncbi:class I SAM-dependent methyltransferase [Massilia sp. S19_KUP03_FR1]|uniref:class I SAM-dependent methyltransferase n=1 Tax=Massilia sp. S19_KUP03_FR1 TaxID=3025503 RepID=UPI002FCDE06F
MHAAAMQIAAADPGPLLDERSLLAALPLAGARALELGCGTARQTRALVETGKFGAILALEADQLQHGRNLEISDLPGVRFGLGGAEDTGCSAASCDAVFLFKSLHHVPLNRLDEAFAEMHRVLAPAGLVYISEPIFQGAYNALLALFHNEQAVRQAAFDATVRAVASGQFTLLSQTFFLAPVRYRDWPAFERAVIGVTHTQHRLAPALLAEVRARFMAHMTDQGVYFEAPFRVDLLQRR